MGMKLKEVWATNYMATNTKHYKTIPAEESFTGGTVIISTYDPQIKEAFLAGFEMAKNEIIKSLEKDYEWDREEIMNVGENE